MYAIIAIWYLIGTTCCPAVPGMPFPDGTALDHSITESYLRRNGGNDGGGEMKSKLWDRWMAAVVCLALGAMALRFAAGQAALRPLSQLVPPAAAAADTERPQGPLVNINTAGLEELMTLPGIGESRARAILNDRAANGRFERPEDLIRVKGIGEGILAGLIDRITT